MLKTMVFTELQAGQQIQVSPGDILEVVVRFKYRVPKRTSVELWLSLVIPPGRDYTKKQEVTLEPFSDVKEWSGPIQMPIEASGLLGILKNYTYDLWFEIPYQTSEVAIAEKAVVITGVVPGLMESVTPLLGLAMMMMVMSMVTSMAKAEEVE